MKSKKPSAKRQTHKKVPAQPTAAPAFVHGFWGGIAIAVLGIVVGQAILYGPSLIGKKILLPLDLLAMPGSYLPLTEQYKNIVPHNVMQSDLILGSRARTQGPQCVIARGAVSSVDALSICRHAWL